jgi:hypothetical protein
MTSTQTTMLTLKPIVVNADQMAEITLAGDTDSITWIVPVDLLLPALVEMFTLYKAAAALAQDVLPKGVTFQSMLDKFPAMTPKNLAINGEITVAYINGDTSAEDFGHGHTLLDAMADIARTHGYESRMSELHRVTIHEWFEGFKYGLERRSDEILNAELAELTGDPGGAW